MDVPFKLKFPTVDDIVDRIIALKGKCLIYKVDIRRAFRILKLDPKDIVYTGLQSQGKYYVDTSVPFGYRHGFAMLSASHRCRPIYNAYKRH